MHQDKREIESVWVATASEEGFWKVGSCGITKIEIYLEDGQMAGVPWCAIYHGDEIKNRFDMAGMGVTYK
jgi:hypothetical protein